MMQLVGNVYLADTARVTGEVDLRPDVSVWYGAAIRGDVAPVHIGSRTNVQDNAVIHCDHGRPNEIGSNVTIGHGAVVHGEKVGDGTLIGMRAVVLGRTVIGKGCLIAAGSVVTPGTHVPDGMLVMGVPGKVARPVNDEEKEYLRWLADHYVQLAHLHATKPMDPRFRAWNSVTPPPEIA